MYHAAMKDDIHSPTALPVWTLSLGCPKNRVDTERFLGSLGVPIRPVEDIRDARLAFINTCGFIAPAVSESVRAVLDAAEAIRRRRNRPLLAVAGCMVGRYGGKELAPELPEADLWLSTAERDAWPAMTRRALGLPEPGDAPGLRPHSAVLRSPGFLGAFSRARLRASAPGRILSTGPAYAWLKIAEGCRHACSFCTIPSIRGPLRSEPLDHLRREARFLLSQGVRELNLVAQDLTEWGADLSPRDSLPRLLSALLELDGLAWLRLFYLYPAGVTPELLRFVAGAGPSLPHYFDIPLQHAHPEMLGRMGRPFAGDPRLVVDRVREALPDAALRTTLIVGHPGETEEHFEALCRFVEEVRFQHLGVFAYQREEGTRAAEMPDQVPDAVKERRRAEIMAIQEEISRENLSGLVGRRMSVLVERPQGEWPGLHVGRAWFQGPEVDGVTYVSGPGVRPGAFVECDVEDAGIHDLTALA